MLSPLEIVLIVFLILLLFGATRLPKMGRGLGRGIRGFKEELTDGLKDDETEPEDRSEREVATPSAVERQ